MAESRLLGVRVSNAHADALDAAAYARRQSMQQLLGPVVEAYAKEVARDPHVKTAIAVRAAVDASKSSNVRPIARKRGKS